MTWLPDAMTSVLVGYDIGCLHTGRAAAMRAHDWTTHSAVPAVFPCPRVTHRVPVNTACTTSLLCRCGDTAGTRRSTSTHFSTG